jgi:hypothetical protein
MFSLFVLLIYLFPSPFRIKARCGSSLPPVVCRRAHVLFTCCVYIINMIYYFVHENIFISKMKIILYHQCKRVIKNRKRWLQVIVLEQNYECIKIYIVCLIGTWRVPQNKIYLDPRVILFNKGLVSVRRQSSFPIITRLCNILFVVFAGNTHFWSFQCKFSKWQHVDRS